MNFPVDVSVRSEQTKAIRMLDGFVTFTDVLGSEIGSYMLDRDVSIAPKGQYTRHFVFGTALDVARLLSVRREDVILSICVKAVVYEDGSKEDFE